MTHLVDDLCHCVQSAELMDHLSSKCGTKENYLCHVRVSVNTVHVQKLHGNALEVVDYNNKLCHYTFCVIEKVTTKK